MQHGITRREFLRYSAAALGSLWLAAALPPASAQATKAAYGTPTLQSQFAALPNPAVFGVPTDVAIGTDGVTWLTGASGAPSTYDPVQETWQPFGGGIDAVAYVPYRDQNGNYQLTVGYFRGSQVFEAGQAAPVAIAARWPGPPALPPSFQGGLDGAANYTNTGSVLFRLGQAAFVLAGGEFGSVRSLTSFNGGWPGGAWAGGVFDYVISGQWAEGQPNYVYFVLGSEYLTVELISTTVMGPPAPLAGFYGGTALALLAAPGNQAVLVDGMIQDPTAALSVFRGPAVYRLENATSAAPAQVAYLAQQEANWPPAWHPALKQAPAGRIGSLWGLAADGVPRLNDGSGWNPAPLPNGAAAIDLDAGADGAVYAIASGALYSLDADGSSWSTAATATLDLAGLSVGSGSFVWVRDSQGIVYQFDSSSGSFTPANLGVTATDIKANPDGTLWHCSAGKGSVYRYLAGSRQASESIGIGQGVSSVLKATSSSFGTGLFLAEQNGQPALLRYTSPYVFKTSNAYFTGAFQSIAVGAAAIFLTLPASGNNFDVVALDAETGSERWRYTYSDPSQGALSPLYDPNHQLVYAFSTLGDVYALDANTGELRWRTSLEPVLPVAPVLAGGLLLFSAYDSPLEFPTSQKVYLIAINTLAALQAAAANQPIPLHWQFASDATGPHPAPTSPVAGNGTVYCAVWSQAGVPNLDVLRLDAATGLGEQLYGSLDVFGPEYVPLDQIAPLVAPITMPGGQTSPMLVFAAPNGLFALQLDGSGQYVQYTNGLSAANFIMTNLVYFGGVIYCGDLLGNVHAVDATFAAVNGAPYRFTNGSMATSLAVAPDAQGAAILLTPDTTAQQVDVYFTSGGNAGTVATNQTQIGALSAVTAEGLIYAGGGDTARSDNLGQVFGIRTSDLRDLRDFIVESQMMQDYGLNATPVARYQTHVTIVDDNKAARPLVDVKLWADATLDVIVGGQPYTIGPDAPLATQVDGSGALTILSDATDLFAAPLRLWAAFMDPNERIVIYPDQEFHARLPNMTADPANDDPDTINLATGTNYDNIKVFTDQNQAAMVAGAVSNASSSLGLGGNSSGNSGGSPGGSPSTQPFIAYADLPGVRYFPANTPAARVPSPEGALGLSLNQDGTNTFVTMGFADAAALIDSLDGATEDRLLGLPPGSWFSSIWDDIKSGAAVIEQIAVSIADVIYIGIQYVIRGVKHVVREVVRDIEDVVTLIGAFFIKLGKLFEDMIELLSLLLHFEQIIATYKILKPALLGQVNALATVIPAQLTSQVNAFFQQGEQQLLDAFCKLKQQIDPSVTCGSTPQPQPGTSPAVNTFTGIGATQHTIYTVAPKSGGQPSSHAVHATWGLHKVKDNYKQATVAGNGPGGDPGQGDPLSDFFATFVSSLTANGALQEDFAGAESDFAATFQVKSAGDFLNMAIVDLLDVLSGLLTGSLAITNALLTGMLARAQAMVSFLVDPNSGLLTQTLDIPIISDLFRLIVQDELTFFNLIVLVASIPISIVYRVIEGAWPADQIDLQAASTATVLARLFGLLEVVCYAANAIFAPMADMFITADETPPVLSYILIGLSIGATIPATYGITDESEAVYLAVQITQTLVGALGDGELFKAYAPGILMVCAIVAIAAAIAEKVKNDVTWAGFSGDFLGEIPTFARPIQYLAQEFPFTTTVLLGSIDMLVNAATALADFISLLQVWDAVPPTALPSGEEPAGDAAGRSYLPFVQGRP